SKGDLGRHNGEFVAVPSEKIVDMVFSSGTTGDPTQIVYTDRDLERLAYNEQQSFASAGMTPRDTVLLTCTIDRCFVAGLAYFLGVRRTGAAAIRSGHALMESHLEIIGRVSPTMIVGVPSFLQKLAETGRERGLNPADMSVERLICIGEPVRDRGLEYLPVGRAVHDLWGAHVHSTYASSEIVTTFCECTAERGGHLHPELGVVEIVDEAGEGVGAGEVGEVVVTPLGVEGMPLIRFRTGDLSFLVDEPCACGRTSPRLGPILARKKQMIKYKGTTLYPQPIATALQSIPAVVEHYVEVYNKDTLSDELIVHVAVNDAAWGAQKIGAHLQSKLRVKPQVEIEPAEDLRRTIFTPESRKPIRFIDRRTS
ncbi:MAG: phenylacetate--CoA ligase family protein, partial [Planctomycetota bacterium]